MEPIWELELLFAVVFERDLQLLEEAFVRAYDDLYVHGNTGIGTTSPGVKLDVVGSVRASTGIVANDDINSYF